VTDRAQYILCFYSDFLTPDEQDAHFCAFLPMKGRDPKIFGREHYTPRVEFLLRDGWEQCFEAMAARVERDHAPEMYFHTCPKCGGLCRTPKAQQCFHCHHDWHKRAPVA
jgi:hypothetical protein